MTRNRSERPRVFCIGWHKTGTSSLGHALVHLGYSVLGCRLDMVHPLRRGNIEVPLELAARFDALQDVPWAALYRELDQSFPGSQFILTEREEGSWLRSAQRHFGRTDIPLHQWLYGEGVMQGNENLYLQRYRQHNQDVKAYFEARETDLLLIDLQQAGAWDSLCGFLDQPVPRRPFPHANKAPQSMSGTERLGYAIRQITPMPIRRAVFSFRQTIRDRMGKPDPRDVFNNRVANRRERASWRKGSNL